MMLPMSFRLCFFEKQNRSIPAKASIGVKVAGLKRLRIVLAPLPVIPVVLRSHDVTEVPRLAPMITPVACLRVISPELTKPTTITVVAEDD